MLVDELRELGVQDASVNEFCIVTGTIPSNSDDKRVMGLLAHMDVSPDAPAANVKPTFHYIDKDAEGKDIVLKEGTVIPWSQIEKYKGGYIISSDGTTVVSFFLLSNNFVSILFLKFLLFRPFF